MAKKVVLVTGAAIGIGRAVAFFFVAPARLARSSNHRAVSIHPNRLGAGVQTLGGGRGRARHGADQRDDSLDRKSVV